MIYIGCLCRVACACSTVFTKGGKQVSRQACRQVDKRETGSHTCGQVDRQAGRHASKRVLLCWNCALVNPKLCCSSCFAFFFVYRFFFSVSLFIYLLRKVRECSRSLCDCCLPPVAPSGSTLPSPSADALPSPRLLVTPVGLVAVPRHPDESRSLKRKTN